MTKIKILPEQRIIKLYKKNMTIKEISEYLGYKGKNARIKKIIKNTGIMRRSGARKGRFIGKLNPCYGRKGKKHPGYGKRSPNWKGGKFKNLTHGYIFIWYKGKYVSEHQLNWCIANQFPLVPKGFVIHHINGIRDDNKPENLALLPRSYHKFLHEEAKRIVLMKNELYT